MFKLIDFETLIPEYLFLHICLKECVRSGRTCHFIHLFLLPGEAGKKALTKNPSKPETNETFSPPTSFWSGYPQRFTQKHQEKFETSSNTMWHASLFEAEAK